MDFTRPRALGSLFSMLNQAVRSILSYNHTHYDFPMSPETIENYISKWLVYSIIWSFTGDCKTKERLQMGDYVRGITTISLPEAKGSPVLDYQVSIEGEWVPWASQVPQMDVETHKVGSPDIVVPTIDTVRHEQLFYTWLADHKPMGKSRLKIKLPLPFISNFFYDFFFLKYLRYI